jgi:hypothetical protein
MSVATAILVVTSTLSMITNIVTWADPLFNPLNASASIITYLVDLGIVMPLAFVAIRKVIGLARGGRRG